MNDSYPGPAPGTAVTSGGIQMKLARQTPLEQLKTKKGALEFELSKINAAIEALEANPAIEKVLGLVATALY